jgi:hypothetical protein
MPNRKELYLGLAALVIVVVAIIMANGQSASRSARAGTGKINLVITGGTGLIAGVGTFRAPTTGAYERVMEYPWGWDSVAPGPTIFSEYTYYNGNVLGDTVSKPFDVQARQQPGTEEYIPFRSPVDLYTPANEFAKVLSSYTGRMVCLVPCALDGLQSMEVMRDKWNSAYPSEEVSEGDVDLTWNVGGKMLDVLRRRVDGAIAALRVLYPRSTCEVSCILWSGVPPTSQLRSMYNNVPIVCVNYPDKGTEVSQINSIPTRVGTILWEPSYWLANTSQLNSTKNAEKQISRSVVECYMRITQQKYPARAPMPLTWVDPSNGKNVNWSYNYISNKSPFVLMSEEPDWYSDRKLHPLMGQVLNIDYFGYTGATNVTFKDGVTFPGETLTSIKRKKGFRAFDGFARAELKFPIIPCTSLTVAFVFVPRNRLRYSSTVGYYDLFDAPQAATNLRHNYCRTQMHDGKHTVYFQNANDFAGQTVYTNGRFNLPSSPLTGEPMIFIWTVRTGAGVNSTSVVVDYAAKSFNKVNVQAAQGNEYAVTPNTMSNIVWGSRTNGFSGIGQVGEVLVYRRNGADLSNSDIGNIWDYLSSKWK